MKQIIKSKLVTIRPPVKSDDELIFNNMSRDIARNTFIPWPYTIEHAHDYIKLSKKNRQNKAAFIFAIVPHKVGHVVGMVSLLDIRLKHSRAEIGYWLGKKHRGREYTAEAVNLALQFAFKQLKFNRVQAHTLTKNAASQKVLENCNFTYEGTLRRYVRHNGRYKDNCMYSILKSEFKRLSRE